MPLFVRKYAPSAAGTAGFCTMLLAYPTDPNGWMYLAGGAALVLASFFLLRWVPKTQQ